MAPLPKGVEDTPEARARLQAYVDGKPIEASRTAGEGTESAMIDWTPREVQLAQRLVAEAEIVYKKALEDHMRVCPGPPMMISKDMLPAPAPATPDAAERAARRIKEIIVQRFNAYQAGQGDAFPSRDELAAIIREELERH